MNERPRETIDETEPDAEGSERVVTPEEVRNTLARFGQCGEIVPGTARNGAWQFSFADPQGNEYAIVSPASRWKRIRATKNGEDHIRAREDGDVRAKIQEVRCLLLEKTKPLDDAEEMALLQEYLKETAEHGVLQGTELESLFDFRTLNEGRAGEEASARAVYKFLPEQMQEGNTAMREHAQYPPARSLEETEAWIKRTVRDVFSHTADARALYIGTGMWPLATEPGTFPLSGIRIADQERIPKEARSRTLLDSFSAGEGIARDFDEQVRTFAPITLQHASLSALRDGWGSVARAFGYSDPVVFAERYGGDIWTSSSHHYSIALPQDKRTGHIPQVPVKNIVNALVYFASILNVPRWSGDLAFGVRVLSERGSYGVFDSRLALAPIIPMALPPALGLPSEDLHEEMKRRHRDGLGRLIDVTTGETRISTGDGDDMRLASIHLYARARVSIPLADFLAHLHEPQVSALPLEARIEYAGGSATPTFTGTLRAAALQHVIHRAGVIAASEGCTDIFQWMIDRGVITGSTSDDIYRTHGTDAQYVEHVAALYGYLDMLKLAALERLIEAVADDARFSGVPEKSSARWETIFRTARQGVESIRRAHAAIRDPEEQRRLTALSPVEKYEYFCRTIGIFGLAANLLTDDEVVAVIVHQFGVATFADITGNAEDERAVIRPELGHAVLVSILGHLHAGSFAREPHSALK